MIEVLINGLSHRVVSLVAELESGEYLELTSPVVKPLVYTPPIMIESVATPTPTVEPKVRKPRKPRTPKAKPEVAAVETPVETPAPAAVVEQPKPKAKGGFRRRKAKSSDYIEVPLSECEALATYARKDDSGVFAVAVWKSGVRGENHTKWYHLLYVNMDTQMAYHNDGGFFANPAKLSDIIVI